MTREGSEQRSGLLEAVRQIVEEDESVPGRLFDACVQFLILTSLVSFSLETLPGLSPGSVRLLRVVEVVTVVAFTLEYGVRVLVARRRRKYVTSFFGVVDLLAVLPFYLASGLDLRSLRALRLLRLFRAVKLIRYSAAVRRLDRAFSLVRDELVLFFAAASLLLFFAAAGIHHFESQVQPEAFASIFHCLWWAVSTLTTVGYGDVYPVTTGGKVFTVLVLGVGLGVVAVPSGMLASALSEARRVERVRGEDNTSDPSLERRGGAV